MNQLWKYSIFVIGLIVVAIFLPTLGATKNILISQDSLVSPLNKCLGLKIFLNMAGDIIFLLPRILSK